MGEQGEESEEEYWDELVPQIAAYDPPEISMLAKVPKKKAKLKNIAPILIRNLLRKGDSVINEIKTAGNINSNTANMVVRKRIRVGFI